MKGINYDVEPRNRKMYFFAYDPLNQNQLQTDPFIMRANIPLKYKIETSPEYGEILVPDGETHIISGEIYWVSSNTLTHLDTINGVSSEKQRRITRFYNMEVWYYVKEY